MNPDHRKDRRPLIIIDDAGPLDPDVWKKDGPEQQLRKAGEVEPSWPDGKTRPYKVMTHTGDVVWLTAEEYRDYDRLRLEAVHKLNANRQGSRQIPVPGFLPGEHVSIELESGIARWGGSVVSVKPDGRMKVSTRGLAAGMRVTVSGGLGSKGGHYVVTAAAKDSVRLRLAL